MDVYADGVADLRGYQIGLQVADGSVGGVMLESVYVDVGHKDFVFAGQDYVQANDDFNSRLALALREGGATSMGTVYLGTFTFRAMPGARGPVTFELRIDDTQMLNSAGEEIPLEVDSNATVTIP